MISLTQIRGLAQDVLDNLGSKFASDDAITLVIATGLVESRFKYIRQLGTGPARGFFQCEPQTALDNNLHYLKHRPKLMRKCAESTLVDLKYWQTGDEKTWSKILETNIAAGIVHCRLKYWRVPKKMPNTGEGMAKMWKDYYNTHLGAGHVEDFMDLYTKYL